jgi:pimeloyl-ACP methyl ester carboxylesterase
LYREGWDRIRQRPAAFPSGAIQNERSALALEFTECRISCFRMKQISVPTFVVHGSDDQIAPIEICGNLTAQIVANAKLVVYEGCSHGLLITQKDRLNADLLAFLKS